MVPQGRCSVKGEPDQNGQYVLYWMTSARRTQANFALQRAVELANETKKPLLVFEPLRVAYPWACDRFHAFVIEGMADNARACAEAGVTYYPYLEPQVDADKGLLAALAKHAAAVVTDDYPAFFLPHLLKAAHKAIAVRFEVVDGNGLVPMRATEQTFLTAYAFRRYLQKSLPTSLQELPDKDPLKALAQLKAKIPAELLQKWPAVSTKSLEAGVDLGAFPIDHGVGKVERQGGSEAAHRALTAFLKDGLHRYREERSQPEANAVSGLSAYLHFGHLAVHEILAALASAFDWTPKKLGSTRSGQRDGFWNVSPDADGFLDELVTWRELGFNFASHRDDYDNYDSLPTWAKETLKKHVDDARPHTYTFAQLERGETADPLWNAAQLQMVREGYMHNYLRMLWGKKVLEWSKTPEQAVKTLIELNNKYELDGRDPNSYSGIFWIFGRYDRPWGPERNIFGLIRYMSSENTARKLRVKEYVARYAGEPAAPRQGKLL